MSSAKRVAYGVALIAVLTLLILLSLRLALGSAVDVFVLPAALILGTAVGGAGLMRRDGAGWPEPVYAGLASSFVVLAVLQAAFPGMGPLGAGSYTGAWRDQAKSVLAYFVVGGAGAFVLPLFDPAVRRAGPAPTVWKVLLAAVGTVALVLAFELVRTLRWGGGGYAFFGIGVLVWGALVALFAGGLGLLLTLVGALDMGAWTGGLGLFVATIASGVWVLAGMRWFP